jgi:hypothetical protein
MRSFWSRNWRRDIHAHPELQYDVHRTAGAVADKLKNFGCDEVVTGIGGTGVVGVIRGSKAGEGGRVIGLRADMDTLPIEEATDVPTSRPLLEKCTPAATTVIPPCCSAPRAILRRRAISPARRCDFSARRRGT